MLKRSIPVGLVIVLGIACGQQPQLGTTASVGPGAMTIATREKAASAQKLFVTWCAGCHGEQGRGDGPGAVVVDAKPRNLTAGPFKIRSTVTGHPPTRQDLFDTVTRGMPGSAMPPFGFLSEDERWALVDQVRRLAGIDQTPDPAVVDLGSEPGATPEAIQRGKAIYARLQCTQCHGPEGRGDGPAAATLKDTAGRPITARDYTKGQYLGGDTARALHARFRTGMDGTPMPAFTQGFSLQDGWDLTYYMLSLRTSTPPPSDPVARGRQVVQERQCFACHVIEGKGGDVGPSLDVAAAKLRYDWVKAYLTDPVAHGKVYWYTPYRMPKFDLKSEEIDGVVALLAKTAGRPYPEPAPVAAHVDAAKIPEGTLLYFLKCTECHNLGKVIPTPEAKQQGPDLVNVSKRIRFEWISTWVNNPKQTYPAARMVDTNLTEDQIRAVTAFVWKTSVDAQAQPR